MSIVWVIENPHIDGRKFLSLLQGNFAIRSFASWSSFVKLALMRCHVKPEVVFVNLYSPVYEIEAMDEYLADRFEGSIRMFMTDKNIPGKPGRILLDLSIGNIELAKLLEDLVVPKKSSTSLTYRDLQMDLESLIVTNVVTGIEEHLTLKESKLLKYFLKHSDRCIDRDELIEKVWEGLKVSPRSIDSQISRLRRRLAPMSVGIESVYGDGYILR